MSVVKVARCDGYSCHNEFEFDEDDCTDSALEEKNWMIDPNDPWTHYCSVCVPKVKKEIDGGDVEGEE
jgi:hypothetical protein